MGIMAGNSNKESARHLNISPRTVELHRGRIKKKFDVKSATDLVRVMLTTGCPPLRRKSLGYSQSLETKVSAVSLGASLKEPEVVPSARQRVRAIT
jgi:hypothetical protein